MIIIAECGATRSDWYLVESGAVRYCTSRSGLNFSTMSPEYISEISNDALEELRSRACSPVTSVHIYAAGVVSPQKQMHLIENSVFRTFRDVTLELQSDILAAARAVCGHSHGVAAILGTGSASCLYDGEKIVRQIASGGFILGDEGSGARLGRMFLSDFIKGLVPEDLARGFVDAFPSDYSVIVKNVYGKGGSPSGYLGSFAPFLLSHYGHPYVKTLIDRNFRDFFERVVRLYNTDKIGLVGGFAHAAADIIAEIAKEYGVKISAIVKSPIELLAGFHKS